MSICLGSRGKEQKLGGRHALLWEKVEVRHEGKPAEDRTLSCGLVGSKRMLGRSCGISHRESTYSTRAWEGIMPSKTHSRINTEVHGLEWKVWGLDG